MAKQEEMSEGAAHSAPKTKILEAIAENLKEFAEHYYQPNLSGWMLWVETTKKGELCYSYQTQGTRPNPENYAPDEEMLITEVFTDLSGASLGELDWDSDLEVIQAYIEELVQGNLDNDAFDCDVQIPNEETFA